MDYFIRIEDPKSLRVALMSTARDALLMQMTLEELQAIRKEKLAMLNCAKEDFRQITNMCKKLSETIADDKVKREILNSLKLKEEIQPIKLREFKPYTKQETKEETKTNLKKHNVKLEPTKPTLKNTLDMLPEIKEENLPMIASSVKPVPSIETKTEADRLEYTLSQIEKKLASLNK